MKMYSKPQTEEIVLISGMTMLDGSSPVPPPPHPAPERNARPVL